MCELRVFGLIESASLNKASISECEKIYGEKISVGFRRSEYPGNTT